MNIIQLPLHGADQFLISSARSFDEATGQLPGGAYTTFRTFQRSRVLRLSDHFARLRETASLANTQAPFSEERVRAALRGLIEQNALQEMRLRLILDLQNQPGDVYLLGEPLVVPSQRAYEQGVAVVTRAMQRSNPRAKLTNFIEQSREVRQELPSEINEALMIDPAGNVLEGLSSNFFGVLAGEIWTAQEGVLIGITRSITIDLIDLAGVPLRLQALPAASLSFLDEAFITSSSRAVLPVTSIDGEPVGNGQPGPITRAILRAYLERIEQSLEPI